MLKTLALEQSDITKEIGLINAYNRPRWHVCCSVNTCFRVWRCFRYRGLELKSKRYDLAVSRLAGAQRVVTACQKQKECCRLWERCQWNSITWIWLSFTIVSLAQSRIMKKRAKSLNWLGWGTGIRTPISGVRVRCLAVRPSPSEKVAQNRKKAFYCQAKWQ